MIHIGRNLKFARYDTSERLFMLSEVDDRKIMDCASGGTLPRKFTNLIGKCSSASGKHSYFGYHFRTNYWCDYRLTDLEIHDIKFNRDLRSILDE